MDSEGDRGDTRPVLKPVLAVVIAASLLSGCNKKKQRDDDEPAPKPVAQKPTPAPPQQPAAPPGADVPFKGKYSKFAESTWKNGRPVRVANANGAATLTVEAGKVTYAQTYVNRGKTNHVTQVYTFTRENIRPVQAGGYDVAMTFQSISGDTQAYSPDKNNPQIQARKQAGGWEIGLITTDNNGIMGGVEFK